MLKKVLYGKIHRARVTEARVDYVGSITIDADLLEASGIRPNDEVVVANCDSGARFETYVFRGEPGMKQVIINGAAGHLASEGDTVIIMNYALMDNDEYREFKPRAVLMNPDNTIDEIVTYDNR